jgi:hypothetical protein
MYVGLHVQYTLLCQILIKLAFSPQIFEKFSNIKVKENASSGSQVVPCGPINEQTDKGKLKPFAILRTRLKKRSFKLCGL